MKALTRMKLGFALVVLSVALGRRAHAASPLPYRFLIVINDQWKDPASEVIEEADEFSMLCALLKSWGLPFEIYRLDQQRFDAYHLLDRAGRARHSTIVWDAPGAVLEKQSADLLRSLVADQGVGLIAFSDTVTTPVIAELTGVKETGPYSSAEPFLITKEHFITRGIAGGEPPPHPITKLLRNQWTAADKAPFRGREVTLEAGTYALASRAGHAALTVRDGGEAGHVAWLDPDRASGQIYRQRWRDLLKRTIVWANGYALYEEYPRSVMLSMDDMGAADKTFYPGWHYQTLSEELIRSGIIEPLQRHHAVIVENIVTGFVDRKTHRVLNPWQQKAVDELDRSVVHDYASTKRGLDAGQKAGVFDIESHGWTHMPPDLDSPPGPLWGAPPASAVVQLNWYKEFGDEIRRAEIPAIVQRVHLQRGIDCLEEDFGVRPVSVVAGGGLSSHSMANNTLRLAAKMGFGLAQPESTCYLGHDLCLTLEPVLPRVQWQYDRPLAAAEMPWTIDAPIFLGFHDRDVAMDPGSLDRLLDNLGGVRFMTFAEYCAYLHADVAREDSPDRLTLKVTYDPAYCDFFRRHASTWVLHVSDDRRTKMEPGAGEREPIRFDAGPMTHIIVR